MEMTMNNDTVMTKAIQEDSCYAGFWMRFWAYLVDVFILFSINGLLLSPIKLLNEGVPYEISFWTLNGILAGVIYYLYFALMTKFFHQTIGKLIFGLQVASVEDKKLAWSDVFFREVLSRFIYNLFLILKVLYIIVAFTEDKRGLHDYLGKTYVVHQKR